MSCFGLIIILVSLALLSCACQGDLIGDLCSKSNNPSLCKQTLASDPRSRGANARALALIVLENAEKTTQGCFIVARKVSNRNNGDKISACIVDFHTALFRVQGCKSEIENGGNMGIVQNDAATALARIDHCSSIFGATQPPLLKDYSGKAYTFIQMLSIVAGFIN